MPAKNSWAIGDMKTITHPENIVETFVPTKLPNPKLMNIQLASDSHFDFRGRCLPPDTRTIRSPDASVLRLVLIISTTKGMP